MRGISEYEEAAMEKILVYKTEGFYSYHVRVCSFSLSDTVVN